MSVRGIRLRVLALCVAVASVMAGMATSHASTTDRLDQAKAELQALSDKVAAQSAAVQDARDRAAAAEARATEASQALIPLTVHRIQLAQRLDDVNAELEASRERFNQAVVDTFVGSPGTVPGMDTVAAVLGAQSLDQLQDQMAFSDAVTREREAAMTRVAALQRRLTRQGSTLDGLIEAARVVRTQRDQAQAEQQAALYQEEQALQELDTARAEVVSLIERLRERLAPQDISDVATAFQGNSNLSYGDWANAFLRVMGAPRCHAEPRRDDRLAGAGGHAGCVEPPRNDPPHGGLDRLQQRRGAELPLARAGSAGDPGDDRERVGDLRVRGHHPVDERLRGAAAAPRVRSPRPAGATAARTGSTWWGSSRPCRTPSRRTPSSSAAAQATSPRSRQPVSRSRVGCRLPGERSDVPTRPKEADVQTDQKRTCAGCGAANELQAGFCWQCYAPFAPAAPPPRSPSMPPTPGAGRPFAPAQTPVTAPSRSRGGMFLRIGVGVVVAIVVERSGAQHAHADLSRAREPRGTAPDTHSCGPEVRADDGRAGRQVRHLVRSGGLRAGRSAGRVRRARQRPCGASPPTRSSTTSSAGWNPLGYRWTAPRPSRASTAVPSTGACPSTRRSKPSPASGARTAASG